MHILYLIISLRRVIDTGKKRAGQHPVWLISRSLPKKTDELSQPSRVEALMGRFEAGGVHLGVDLGGGDVRVAEHHLHGPQVGAAGQQVGGERMAEHVRADPLLGCPHGLPGH